MPALTCFVDISGSRCVNFTISPLLTLLTSFHPTPLSFRPHRALAPYATRPLHHLFLPLTLDPSSSFVTTTTRHVAGVTLAPFTSIIPRFIFRLSLFHVSVLVLPNCINTRTPASLRGQRTFAGAPFSSPFFLCASKAQTWARHSSRRLQDRSHQTEPSCRRAWSVL